MQLRDISYNWRNGLRLELEGASTEELRRIEERLDRATRINHNSNVRKYTTTVNQTHSTEYSGWGFDFVLPRKVDARITYDDQTSIATVDAKSLPKYRDWRWDQYQDPIHFILDALPFEDWNSLTVKTIREKFERSEKRYEKLTDMAPICDSQPEPVGTLLPEFGEELILMAFGLVEMGLRSPFLAVNYVWNKSIERKEPKLKPTTSS